ncbi:OsmC family peroxiredoxin [bacterium]|nr:MAG: OsmC family peroxiredoxin [bacterium]
MDVTADLSKETPICFRNIAVSIDLKGTKLDTRRIQAMLEFIKNCPVHNTLKNNPEVEIKII